LVNEEAVTLNERELMEYYGYVGFLGRIKLRTKILYSWALHSFAYSSPHSAISVWFQRMRGVKIGNGCHLCPYVLLDLIYPHLIKIENNVTIGSNAMLFAHSNPTASIFLKNKYPRKVAEINIKSGVVINPGCIITAGVTIGENTIISPGSVVTESIPPYCVAVGNPARVVKKIEH